MAGQGWSKRFVVLGTVVALSAPFLPGDAEAARSSHHAHSYTAFRGVHHGTRVFAARHEHAFRGHWHQGAARYVPADDTDYADAADSIPREEGRISCVPFARENSGIELVGNAATWWRNAAGVYARGNQPELGSVLNFRATGRMHLGHVAVVTNVLGPRVLEVDHANWSAPGAVSRGVRVVDVSPANDWTEVRVALGQGDNLGSVYPTYGFIYDRPENRGTMLADAADALVPRAAAAEVDEVAELPDAAAPRLRHGARHVRMPVAEEARRHHHRRYHRG
jgi:hypothetical protein